VDGAGVGERCGVVLVLKKIRKEKRNNAEGVPVGVEMTPGIQRLANTCPAAA